MSKLKLPIIIVIVLAAAGAGLFASGMIGGKAEGPVKKHVIEPITLAEPGFTLNLADADSQRILSFNIALQLEPMDEVHWAAFTGAGGGGHGAGAEPPGPAKVKSYPRFQNAVITVASTFTYERLSTDEGKAELKEALLKRFHEIAEQDEATYSQAAGSDDPTHVGPPYHVQDIEFTKFVMQ